MHWGEDSLKAIGYNFVDHIAQTDRPKLSHFCWILNFRDEHYFRQIQVS